MTMVVTESKLARAATLFHALSDETRLEIMEKLRGGERCVCELVDDLEAAQSRLSFHLRVLKDAGLVTDRKEGRWSYYTIVPEALAELHDVTIALQPSAQRRELRKVGRCC
ncbi:MAG TPA: metalloregulator ArsR/SmtB family transcription factor [Gemmatimonadaceae bacterium]|nr:metalloregulator ArsR/SmtB family transcription factor [Gemmatimonadaceae bacterium]